MVAGASAKPTTGSRTPTIHGTPAGVPDSVCDPVGVAVSRAAADPVVALTRDTPATFCDVSGVC